MAKADQIKALIRSHWSDDPERFLTVALQVAAYEAQQGHRELAMEIRDIVDKARADRKHMQVRRLQPELEGLVHIEMPEVHLEQLVLPAATMERLQRIVQEFVQRDKLRQHGLSNRRKILLTGPPGTGKTMTAKALARTLHLPLMIVQVDKLASKYMGETGAKLRKVFELIERRQGVYFFDEFDALGVGRDRDNDVGEMHRVLNALLQFMEQDRSDSLVIAATNSPQLLDRALFRRFDDVLAYELPDAEQRRQLMANVLATYLPTRLSWSMVLKESEGMSQAEVASACLDVLKTAVLEDRNKVTATDIVSGLHARKGLKA